MNATISSTNRKTHAERMLDLLTAMQYRMVRTRQMVTVVIAKRDSIITAQYVPHVGVIYTWTYAPTDETLATSNPQEIVKLWGQWLD